MSHSGDVSENVNTELAEESNGNSVGEGPGDEQQEAHHTTQEPACVIAAGKDSVDVGLYQNNGSDELKKTDIENSSKLDRSDVTNLVLSGKSTSVDLKKDENKTDSKSGDEQCNKNRESQKSDCVPNDNKQAKAVRNISEENESANNSNTESRTNKSETTLTTGGDRLTPHKTRSDLTTQDTRSVLTTRDTTRHKDNINIGQDLKREHFWRRFCNLYLLCCKTDLHVFMAYTAVTVVTSFLAGTLISTILNSWYVSNQEGRILLSVMQQMKDMPNVPHPQFANTQHVDARHWKQQVDEICQMSRNETLKSVNKTVKNLEWKLNKTRDELHRNHSTLADDVLWKQISVEGKVSSLSSYSLNSVWSYLIVLLGLGEVLMLVVICKMLPLLKRLSGRGDIIQHVANVDVVENRSENRIWGSADILDKIHPTMLVSGVCTISFYSESVSKHDGRTRNILQGSASTRDTKTASFVVNRHEDVLRVPRYKVYVVCVDFNERNVILEDPNKGLGDLRLTTVQGLHRMGGDVILLYARDTGSRHLPPGSLYNEGLTSIKTHPELSNLSARRRMFSICEEFTNSQKDQIRKIVSEII
ncbi:uncharacterized protein LOC121383403 [Gigantopelta aegis]|uniref:uncharacterized protein LOC121383403 n=1 Tax=Gigantopelta aegis TaxID=1735272 RepID=UPI001B88B18A|nr:uncharacterized protein LOC121383403 [Gigantopelta aegis]